jgi:hypothetical protein
MEASTAPSPSRDQVLTRRACPLAAAVRNHTQEFDGGLHSSLAVTARPRKDLLWLTFDHSKAVGRPQ